MSQLYTKQAKKAIDLAIEITKELKHKYLGTQHLLLGLLDCEDSLAGEILLKNGVEKDKILTIISETISKKSRGKFNTEVEFSPMANKVLEFAKIIADKNNEEKIATEHILLSLLKHKEALALKILYTMQINVADICRDLFEYITIFDNDSDSVDFSDINILLDDTAFEMPTLDKFTVDLTQKASEDLLEPVIGRSEEIQRTIQILSRRTKNNPCIIGYPGVGKTAIVEAIAKYIIEDNVPNNLKDKKILRLDLSAMVAGTKYRGEFEERIKNVMSESVQAGNIILFIDELHTIIGAGGSEGSMDAANILKPALSRGELQVIGVSTYDEYRKYIEKDLALVRRFQTVKINEPTYQETCNILDGIKYKYEKYHNIIIDKSAIESAVKLTNRYITDRYLPDKAIDILDEASSKLRTSYFIYPEEIIELKEQIDKYELEKEEELKKEEYAKAKRIKKKQAKCQEELKLLEDKWQEYKLNKKPILTDKDIIKLISIWTKIPLDKLNQKENEKLKKLEEELKRQVIAQDDAIKVVTKAIKRGRLGIKDPNRPIGSFLFLGPTGVGKTELSKVLVDLVFGNKESFIRLDMSEYMEKHTISKIIGSPPGYVGYEAGGQLSEKIRQNPYSLILFDEIEKAHQDVFNILLQVLDDGHITDSQGTKIDFKNTIIIMTSNIGAMRIVEPKKLGFGAIDNKAQDYTDMKKNVMEEVQKSFKPEFLNRIDDIVVFHQLEKEDMLGIMDLLIDEFNKHIKENLNISLDIDTQVKKYLVDKAYDKKYGARPLKRVLQSEIKDKLADLILDKGIKNNEVIKVILLDVDDKTKEIGFIK